MVRSPFPPGSLHLTWFGNEFALWAEAGATQIRDLHLASSGLFGPDVRTALGDQLSARELHDPDGRAPRSTVETMSMGVHGLAEAMLRQRPTSSWSPSLQWTHRAVLAAVEIAATRRILPTVRTAGLRWRAEWTPLVDPDVETLYAQLAASCPPVVLAGSDKPPNSQIGRLMDALVDAVCRIVLNDEEWRPPLPRTRASAVVALRRITSALSRPDPIFLGDSIAHETAFGEWATQLSESASLTTGAPDVRLRGRLEPPGTDDDESNDHDWTLHLEVVPHDGDAIGFLDIWEDSEVARQLADHTGRAALRTRLRQVIDRIGSQVALFAELMEDPRPHRLTLDVDDVSELLSDAIDMCHVAGLKILTPDGLVRTSPRLTASASTPALSGLALSSTLVDVDWGIALGDIELSPSEIEELARSSADLISLRGAWVQVDQRQIRSALDRLETQRRDAGELTPAEFLRHRVDELERGADDLTVHGWIQTLLSGLPDDELSEAEEPAGFVGELRPYQRRALGWLQFLGRLGLGGCLADDMGLGKTPTALAHLLGRTLERVAADHPHRPHLVICPLSVVTNWEREAERFTPELRVLIVHGADRPRGAKLREAAERHDVVVTTYGTAARIAEELESIAFDVVVCDEAQAIKNHRTNAAATIRTLRSEQRVALTGTPVENRLRELWAILDALNPGMLGGITWFTRTFATPIESGEDPEALDSLRQLTAPFVLRRSKADRTLVPELPDKVEQVAWASLSPEQAGLYQALVDEFLTRADTVGGMERRGMVLATLTKLKQVCNHPAHFLGEAELGEPGRSGKLTRFDEVVDALLEADEKAIVFTQYREMGHLLSAHLASRLGRDAPFLHGGTTQRQRVEMVDRFQSGDGPPIQVISLRAGGTGLNLTAASRVIHYDRWWNPAVEDQATDRTWRIGQDKTVFVHKLVCRGTLEERIDRLLAEKQALADAVVRSDESWLTEMSTDELRTTLRLESAALADREDGGL